MSDTITALDLFAGTGWGVACKRLGIREMGVEIMPEAIATRDANGMATIYRDVWDGLEGKFHVPAYQLLIASPPCQTFSLAGKGSGRAALNEVLEAIELHAYKDPTQLREFGEKHDPRTALVLAPLAHVWRDRPEYVAFEQVPTVLPVWEACAEVMREWGYDVKVANLQAEQYGVPQTRKRAILVGRLNGPVSLPTPTHSKYYSRTPGKLDEGVLPWVSMAEALGWGMTERPSLTITGGSGRQGGPDPLDGGSGARATIRAAKERGAWEGDTARRATLEDAIILQSYPPSDVVFRNGNQAHASKRPLTAPAPTIMFGARSNKVEWMDADDAKDPAANGQRVSVDEASTLQSYEPPFIWNCGKTKAFLQIGNAVPPLLAQAVLAALVERDV
jgi:DNA (cytosine-5)-methyltransferase 1